MQKLVNRHSNITFHELEEAKKYYTPNLTEFPECTEYVEDIKASETLEELAIILNRYTDTFGDGSEFEYKE